MPFIPFFLIPSYGYFIIPIIPEFVDLIAYNNPNPNPSINVYALFIIFVCYLCFLN